MTVTGTASPFVAPNESTIVKSTIPVFLMGRADTTDLCARKCVQSKGAGADEDLLEIIQGAANSKRITGWVTFGFVNKVTLAANNANPTKSTTFAANDQVEIAFRIPVTEAILTTGQGTCYPGQRYICGGAGYLATHPDSLYSGLLQSTGWGFPTSTGSGNLAIDPTIAIGLSLVSTADATQVIQVMPLW